jgi:hypothetical protein
MIHPENRADVAIVDDRLTRTPARRKKIGTRQHDLAGDGLVQPKPQQRRSVRLQ